MHVSRACHPIAADPAGRLLRGGQVARASASRREQRDPVVGDLRAQVRQERLTAADLRREIVRLRGELARLRRAASAPKPGAAQPTADGAGAAPDYARKSYAPEPVGLVRPRPAAVRPEAAAAPIVARPLVSNLGTLIDTWA